MEGKRQGIFEVLTFISQNRNMFRGPVQGPVGLEMNTRPEYAPYVEAQVSFGHLFVFVVSCRQDEEALSAFIKSRRFNFQVATVDGNSNQTSHPVGPASQFARAGVECTLDEVVEVSQPVMSLDNLSSFPLGVLSACQWPYFQSLQTSACGVGLGGTQPLW